MTQVRTFVDPVGPVKAWLRAQTITDVAQRVYIGDPEGATLPYIALALVDGETDHSEAPLAMPRIQCVVQAEQEVDAAVAVWDLVGVVESITPGTLLDSTLACHGARRVLGPIPRDDESGPRYLVEFEFSVLAR